MMMKGRRTPSKATRNNSQNVLLLFFCYFCYFFVTFNVRKWQQEKKYETSMRLSVG